MGGEEDVEDAQAAEMSAARARTPHCPARANVLFMHTLTKSCMRKRPTAMATPRPTPGTGSPARCAA